MHQKNNKSNQKINIWFFNQNANSPDIPGGTRHFDFSKQLAKRFNCSIFTSNFHGFERKRIRGIKGAYKTELINNVRFIWIRSLGYKNNGISRVANMFIFGFQTYLVATRAKFDKPDIIIGSSPHLLTALSAYKVSRFYKVPFVLEIRDIWPLTLIDLGHSKYHPFIVFLVLIERFLYSRAVKIIMLMENGDLYLKKIRVNLEKFTWISNGVDLDWLSTKSKNKLFFEKHKFNITYAGTIGEANDIETVIQAAQLIVSKNPKIQINLFGNGVKRHFIASQIKKLNLNNVKLFDPVAKKDIFAVLQESDALLFTLKQANVFKYGNPPNKIFDYLACSKPIIFSSNASNNLIKRSGSGLTIKPSNPHHLARAMIKISRMSLHDRKLLGKKGFKFVENNYQVYNLAKKYEEVLISSIKH